MILCFIKNVKIKAHQRRLVIAWCSLLCVSIPVQSIDRQYIIIVHEQVYPDQSLLKMYTTIQHHRTEKHDIDDIESDQYDIAWHNQSFINKIITVLLGMYEKIIGATVTYYLCSNLEYQPNLHEKIAHIIAKDSIKIIGIIGNECIYFFTDDSLSNRRKVVLCCCAISCMIGIKLFIDHHIPYTHTPQDAQHESAAQESSYVSDKFDHWK